MPSISSNYIIRNNEIWTAIPGRVVGESPYGEFISKTGRVYKGIFSAITHKPDGFGEFFWPDGSLAFSGMIKDGRYIYGTRYDADGIPACTAKFDERERIIGKCVVYNEEGVRCFEGFVNESNEREGWGIEYGADGIAKVYEGEFKGNKRHGKGTVYFKSGNPLFKGEFWEGKYVRGIIYYKNGVRLYEGEVDGRGGREGFGIEYGIDGKTALFAGRFKNNDRLYGRARGPDRGWSQGWFCRNLFYGERYFIEAPPLFPLLGLGQIRVPYVTRGIWERERGRLVRKFEENNPIVEFFRNVIGSL
jgi:hypothetical protein